jgi:RNA polymerase sigma-70 factor (ECF subfamily)
MTAVTATHAELADLIAHGDRKRAASLLVRDHAPAVFALCRAMVRDARLAEDLSQDAFARAFGALEGFRGEASPRTWLLRIARNRCLDHLDHARRAPWAAGADAEPDEHPADEPPPHDLLARREDAERAMAALGESERALVVLHFGHGAAYAELAGAFGLREGTVRMRISRALARMRAALAADLDSLARSGAFDDTQVDAAETLRSRRYPDLDVELADDEDEAQASTIRPTERFELDDALGEAAPAPAMRGAAAPVRPGASPRSAPPTTFGALRDDLPPALRGRLEALAATA